jgi:glycosyltransferase involved in cell wall biosynthesis
MTVAIPTSSVGVGIPTYNRVKTLERALRSVLEQTHSNLEIIVSDDASTDDTETLCRTIAAQDTRIRVIRQAHNIGQFANFNLLFTEFRSPYVMVLNDDDWLEPDYVERCLTELGKHPDCVAVSGCYRYWRGDTVLERQGSRLQLTHVEGAERVRALMRLVGEGKLESSTFFGVMRAEAPRRATPMPIVLAGDILLVARIVFQGQARILEDVHLNRSVGGTSATMALCVAAHGLPPSHARWPNFVIAGEVLRDLGWRNSLFTALPPARRLSWGLRCALSAINWRSVAWHATAPTAASLGKRPRGQWVWLAYDRLTRALGAEGVQGQLLVDQSRTAR